MTSTLDFIAIIITKYFAYRLIQGSDYLIFPHERNLSKIKIPLVFRLSIQILGEVTTTFDDLGRHVILQMDEVHILSVALYKGGE